MYMGCGTISWSLAGSTSLNENNSFSFSPRNYQQSITHQTELAFMSLSPSMLGFSWLGLMQVLCRQFQLVWVHVHKCTVVTGKYSFPKAICSLWTLPSSKMFTAACGERVWYSCPRSAHWLLVSVLITIYGKKKLPEQSSMDRLITGQRAESKWLWMLSPKWDGFISLVMPFLQGSGKLLERVRRLEEAGEGGTC